MIRQALLYVSTNATHIHQLPLHYMAASGPRTAMTRMMSDLAMNTPVEELQVISAVSCFDYTISCLDRSDSHLQHPAPRICLDGGEHAAWL